MYIKDFSLYKGISSGSVLNTTVESDLFICKPKAAVPVFSMPFTHIPRVCMHIIIFSLLQHASIIVHMSMSWAIIRKCQSSRHWDKSSVAAAFTQLHKALIAISQSI